MEDMGCADALRQIYHYLDGELTDEKREAIAVHLGDCSPCADGFGFEVELSRLVASKCQETPPSGLRERIAQAITQLDP